MYQELEEWYVINNYGDVMFPSRDAAKEYILSQIEDDYLHSTGRCGNLHIKFDERISYLIDSSNPDTNYFPDWSDIKHIFDEEIENTGYCSGLYIDGWRLVCFKKS